MILKNGLNHRHDQIAVWLVSNPERSLGDCAATFNYSLSWLSQIVHSDAFQARYRQLCHEVGLVATHTIKNKLNGLAAMALDRIQDKIANDAASERLLGETMKITLVSLGFGSPSLPGLNIDNRTLIVDSQILIAARERADRLQAGTTGTKLEEQEGGGLG